jgi:RNA polymerase sigma-70 factor (ECF subfamily)
MDPLRLDGEAERWRDLMRRYQQDDIGAFEELYSCTLPMFRDYLGALARDRARATDLAQESYLQLHRSRHTYDLSQPLRPWLLAIARHVWLMDRRRRARRLAREVVGLSPVPDLPVPSEIEGLIVRDTLASMLARLCPEGREAIVLHHIHGHTFREVAHMVKVTEAGARIRSSRALNALRIVANEREQRH